MPAWDQEMKEKIVSGFKSHPVMKMNVESRGYDSEKNVEGQKAV